MEKKKKKTHGMVRHAKRRTCFFLKEMMDKEKAW
jgi:hypothetical protein